MRKLHRASSAPAGPASVTGFVCRSCGITLTGPLRRLDDSAALATRNLAPLVPEGTYWRVTPGHLPTWNEGVPVDFTGCYAIRPDALIAVGEHSSAERWMGCCGPSGGGGPNRICSCGSPIGTERSDCMWPIAVYLDPQLVCPSTPAAEPGPAADVGLDD
jgi:hypothetical protein